jgi:hypothetical protein
MLSFILPVKEPKYFTVIGQIRFFYEARFGSGSGRITGILSLNTAND